MPDLLEPLDHRVVHVVAVLYQHDVERRLFLRFWRRGRDRLFAFFSAGFFILGVHWLALAFVTMEHGSEHVLYGIRLLAFGLIIVGVVDKNRSQR